MMLCAMIAVTLPAGAVQPLSAAELIGPSPASRASAVPHNAGAGAPARPAADARKRAPQPQQPSKPTQHPPAAKPRAAQQHAQQRLQAKQQPPRPRVYGFNVIPDGRAVAAYDWDLLTGVGWLEDPQLTAIARARGAGVELRAQHGLEAVIPDPERRRQWVSASAGGGGARRARARVAPKLTLAEGAVLPGNVNSNGQHAAAPGAPKAGQPAPLAPGCEPDRVEARPQTPPLAPIRAAAAPPLSAPCNPQIQEQLDKARAIGANGLNFDMESPAKASPSAHAAASCPRADAAAKCSLGSSHGALLRPSLSHGSLACHRSSRR
jgi:hypothetical protein